MAVAVIAKVGVNVAGRMSDPGGVGATARKTDSDKGKWMRPRCSDQQNTRIGGVVARIWR